jgi:hypothetical protein
MKVYIIKYALTEGVRIREVDEKDFLDNSTIIVHEFGITHTNLYFKNEWCLTEDEVTNKVIEMKQKKIHSLKKSLCKLENSNIKWSKE